MKPNIYSSGDYAGLETGRLKFYYGYEQTIADMDSPNAEEWCFVVWKDGKEKMRIPTTQLDDLGNMGSPKDYLLAGIALYLSR